MDEPEQPPEDEGADDQALTPEERAEGLAWARALLGREPTGDPEVR